MTSESFTDTKPVITKNSSEFKLDSYASISTGELVVFSVQLLQADGAPVAVEEIVSTCFRLFPHSFALKNYFYWPDSALVSRRLHDAKEKGLLKGNPTDGYETKGSGKQIAKQVAKTLGVSLPVPPKTEVVLPPVVVEAPKSAEVIVEKKETAPSAPVPNTEKKQGKNKKDIQKKAVKAEKKASIKKKVVTKAKPKKEVATSVKKKPVQKTQTKPASKAKVQSKQKTGKPTTKPKVVVKPVTKVVRKEEKRSKKVQPAVKPESKKAAPKVEKVVKKKQDAHVQAVKPPIKPEIKKVAPIVEKKEERTKKEAKSQPTQLSMPLAPAAAWKKAESPANKPKVQKEAPQVVKGEVLPALVVSKEEKDKAAKVIKQVERSDAYQLYRRNGRRAQIGEFDFRNMLFATMESSPETLKRNVDLFKRYAGIHFRTDLIAFLEFCEESFSTLLISKVKGKK